MGLLPCRPLSFRGFAERRERRRSASSLFERPALGVWLDHPSGAPAAFGLQIEATAARRAVVVGRPGVAEHVRAKIVDVGTHFEAVEQLERLLEPAHCLTDTNRGLLNVLVDLCR